MKYFLSKEHFQTLLSSTNVSRLEKLLLILFWENESEKASSEIKEIASDNGLRECKNWNVSDILGGAKGKAASIKGKWGLTAPGRAHLFHMKFVTEAKSKLVNDVADIRGRLSSIKEADIKDFIEETICLHHQLLVSQSFSKYPKTSLPKPSETH